MGFYFSLSSIKFSFGSKLSHLYVSSIFLKLILKLVRMGLGQPYSRSSLALLLRLESPESLLNILDVLAIYSTSWMDEPQRCPSPA